MRLMKLLGVVLVMVTAATSSAASSVLAAWPGTEVELKDACEPDVEHPPLCKRHSTIDMIPGWPAVLLPPAFTGFVIGVAPDRSQPMRADGPDLPPFSLALR